ncbi:MAG TPA: DUF92 domain-containing protein [Thermomicrobiales bacterium]|nr:DUF92 domain-containing protein [Thermomicrobiales bacterium]
MLQDLLTSIPGRTVAAFILALLISLLAYRASALAPSGAVAATIVGTLIVSGGGWWAGLALVVFFVTSSALSLWRKRRRRAEQRRGSRRDAVQVLANGGPAALLAIIAGISSSPLWVVALIASLAAANADTWATEIGGASGTIPRLITTLKPAPPGTSGAISPAGTLAAIAGALLISLVGGLGALTGTFPGDLAALPLIAIVAVSGFFGCLADSLLGATVQALYRCPSCNVLTEHPVHTCGETAVLIKGHRWIDNDVVNVTAVTFGALLGLVLIWLT